MPYDRWRSQFRSHRFAGNEASISSDPDLLAHVKTYVFATRYLVDSLRVQCLKSLHRDFCSISTQLTKCISHPWSATVYLRAYRQRRAGLMSFSQRLGHSLCIMWGLNINGKHSLSAPFGWVRGNGVRSHCKTYCVMRFLSCQIQKTHVRTIILENGQMNL